MKVIFTVILLAGALFLQSCGGREKKSMTGDVVDLEMEDFVTFFDPLKLPLVFTDTLLSKKGNDSLLVGHPVFTRFLGDTVLKSLYPKEKPKIYAMGSFRNGDQEIYLVYRTRGASTHAVYISALDAKMQPRAHMVLIASKGPMAEINKVTIDPRFTFALADDYKNRDGSKGVYTSVYAYNTAGLFMEIMNDGLRKGEELKVINPIDTLPATRLHTGDFVANERNFISVRDGATPQKVLFFLNMDKGGDCVAEIKGEAIWVKKDSAFYEAKDDPCKLGFRFTSNRITITESGACGSKRPGGCSFNASYRLKPAPKSTKKAAMRAKK